MVGAPQNYQFSIFNSKIPFCVYLKFFSEKEKSNMKNTEKTMDKIVALCKNRGFVFPGSEIYGGLANTWDYGPLGAELKKNIKKDRKSTRLNSSH